MPPTQAHPRAHARVILQLTEYPTDGVDKLFDADHCQTRRLLWPAWKVQVVYLHFFARCRTNFDTFVSFYISGPDFSLGLVRDSWQVLF